MDETPDTLIDSREAARRMGVALATLGYWRWAGVPDQPLPLKVGKRGVRYRASDVAKWVASRQSKAKPPRQ
jgi:predicted DNA-binding transcriptional regulator AlpA